MFIIYINYIFLIYTVSSLFFSLFIYRNPQFRKKNNTLLITPNDIMDNDNKDVKSGSKPIKIDSVEIIQQQKVKEPKRTKKAKVGKPKGRLVRSFSTQLIVQEVINNLTCGQIFKSFFVIAFLFLIFSLAAFHFLLFYLYSRAGHIPFARTDREYVWIFLLMSIQYLLLFTWLIWRWRKLIKKYLKDHYGVTRNSSSAQRLRNGGWNLLALYNATCGLNGSHYLHRLYAWEIIENTVQIYNLQYIYLCTLPVPLTCVISGLLMIESSHRAYILSRHIRNNRRHKITVQERDHQIILDMLMDIFFLTVPLGTIYLGFRIQVTIVQTMWLVLTPSLSLFSKFRRMTMRFYFRNAATLVIEKQKVRSSSINRRRLSIFSKTYSDEVEDLQNKTFPRWMKLVVLFLSLGYAIFMFAVLIVNAARFSQASTKCERQLEEIFKGCKLQVPFCGNMFEVSCDCAVLEMKDHNMTKLPKGISTLKSLQKVTIINGPLQSIPQEIENLNKLFTFNLKFNQLKEFNIDISQWENIITIQLAFNKIKFAHKSLWNNKNLINLEINSNEGFQIPKDTKDINLPHLQFFHAGNNSVDITPILSGAEQLPSIRQFFLNGNSISHFPESFVSLGKTVIYLGIARCKLLTLPSALSEFKLLKYIDARNNNISSIDILFNKNVDQYFDGNPVCDSMPSDRACETVCSKYCYERKSVKDGFCDDSCNSVNCDYDGGDCKEN